MKNKKGLLLRLLAVAFIIVMMMAMVVLPASAITSYRKATNNVSSSYSSGRYYQNLMKVPLTGDGVTDVLAVAMSQMGYSEGSSSGQFSGTVAGSKNYTEFNYNFGDITGNGCTYEWCASFCTWSLWQSRVIPDGHGGYSAMCRNHLNDGSKYYWREIGCNNWAIKLKNMGMYGYRGSYTPKSGDLIFFNRSGTIGHIGLVVWCNGSTVYTIEGNTSPGDGTVVGNGGGVYYKAYSLSNTGINGYGRLPYPSKNVTKVDYSGKNKTAGLYMTKADFYVATSRGGSNSYKIPRYYMFKVTGFESGYAVIEYNSGKYYGTLNSNTIQISANQHQHSYKAGNDATNHYQICSGCGDKQSVTAHSFTQKYNENQHYMECSCQYKKDVADHVFKYVMDGDIHKLVCDCGYEKPNSQGTHIYNIFDSNNTEHYYRCECGKIDEATAEAHNTVLTYDENNHFNQCETCGKIIESSVEAHRYTVSTNYEQCECGYDRSGIDDGHDWEIKYDEENHYHKCTECGEIRPDTTANHSYDEFYIDGEYHYYMCPCGLVANDTKQKHVYDREGFVDEEDSQVHLKACVCGALLEGTEEAHYYDELKCDEDGHWFECVCGFKSEISEHTREDGTCTECLHHAHQYSHDNEGHWMTCDCYGSGYFGKHIIKNGKCTVCEYAEKPDHEHVIENGECAECGYHEHNYNYNEEGHWYGCSECYKGSRILEEHKLVKGKCEKCEYVQSQKILHTMENGTCTDCGHHEHIYLYDGNGHKNICDCYLSGKIEKHTLKDGKCAVCGYNAKDDTDTGDGQIEELSIGDSVLNLVETGVGCEAALGAASVVMSTVLALGCGITFKKKKD